MEEQIWAEDGKIYDEQSALKAALVSMTPETPEEAVVILMISASHSTKVARCRIGRIWARPASTLVSRH